MVVVLLIALTVTIALCERHFLKTVGVDDADSWQLLPRVRYQIQAATVLAMLKIPE